MTVPYVLCASKKLLQMTCGVGYKKGDAKNLKSEIWTKNLKLG
jgi:hypothetical protein